MGLANYYRRFIDARAASSLQPQLVKRSRNKKAAAVYQQGMVARLRNAAERQQLAARPLHLQPSMAISAGPVQAWTRREAAALGGVSADAVLGWALVRTGENGRRQRARSKRPDTEVTKAAVSPTKFDEARAKMRARPVQQRRARGQKDSRA